MRLPPPGTKTYPILCKSKCISDEFPLPLLGPLPEAEAAEGKGEGEVAELAAMYRASLRALAAAEDEAAREGGPVRRNSSTGTKY